MVLIAPAVVHPRKAFAAGAKDAASATAPAKTAKPAVRFEMRYDPGKLPAAVRDMTDAILAATHSGNVADLATPIEWNEMRPIFSADGTAADTDELIGHLKKASGDGEGRELLAVLANLLSVGPAEQPLGRDFENNTVYVWPYLAELPLDTLTPAQQVDLYRLVPADKAAEMRKTGRWTWYRLAIGADGTWHSFMLHP